MTKVHKLIPLKDNVKIIEDGKRIRVNIMIPLDREDFAFLKRMYEMDVDVSGNIIDVEGNVVQTFSNAVRSLGLNQVELDDSQMNKIKDSLALEDKS